MLSIMQHLVSLSLVSHRTRILKILKFRIGQETNKTQIYYILFIEDLLAEANLSLRDYPKSA